MYASYWNLRERPFQNVADSRFVYLSDQHQEGLARLLYVVGENKLGGVLVGPYGVGKSMILELLGENVRNKQEPRFMKIDAAPTGSLALAKQIVWELDGNMPISDLADALNAIKTWCRHEPGHVSRLVIAIDEAQMLKDEESYDFLRLLTNLRMQRDETASPETAVTIILSGHSDLMNTMRAHSALCQRMQLFWELRALSDSQTIEYVHHRMRAAGGDIWVFDEESLHELFHASQGIPRIINNICDVALLLGYSARAPKVGRDIMVQAINEAESPAWETTPPGAEETSA